MDRREALKKTSFIVGYSLTASAIAATVQSCKPEAGTVTEAAAMDWNPVFLDKQQVELVAELSETIIPETSTPGAKSVNVQQYIDDELQNFCTPHEQYAFVQGLNDVQGRAQAAYGKTFEACSMEERTELLKELEADAEQESGRGRRESFFRMLKNMTFRGYFTSEKVGEQVLAYDPIPGAYHGCIPYSDVGKLWSL